MHLNALKARPGTGRISMVGGRYVSADLVSTIFSSLTVRTVQEADRWLQRLARGWAASVADLNIYLKLSEMIQSLLREAAVVARVVPSRLDRLRREATARLEHRKEQARAVKFFFDREEEDPLEELAESGQVDWFGDHACLT